MALLWTGARSINDHKLRVEAISSLKADEKVQYF